MFIASKLIFLELHKTGSSHIGKILDTAVGGEQHGKHNSINSPVNDRYVLGSIRNPWDWYVSLWAYGCSGQGSVYHQLIDPPNLRYYWRDLPREMNRRFITPTLLLKSWLNDRSKPLSEWVSCYKDPANPELFRRWLRMLLDSDRSLDPREGYGLCPISIGAGLLTYRYFKLFTDMGSSLYTSQRLADPDSLPFIFEQRRVVDHIIRNEHLEDDLLAGIASAGYEVADAMRSKIYAARSDKTNTSARKGIAHYYDADSAALVAQKEQFIIQRHNYSMPFTLS